MGCMTMTKHIEAAPGSVFDVFSDVTKAADRISGIERIEMLTDGPVGLGTRFRETRIMFKKEATEEMEFTAFEPGRSYTIGCESCGCRYAYAFHFEPDGSGTRIDIEMSYQPISFAAKLMTPLGWMMKGTLKKYMDRDLEDLRAVVETKA